MNFREGLRRLELTLLGVWTSLCFLGLIVTWLDDGIGSFDEVLSGVVPFLAIWLVPIFVIDMLTRLIAWIWNGFFSR
jgi:hypothetical protein